MIAIDSNIMHVMQFKNDQKSHEDPFLWKCLIWWRASVQWRAVHDKELTYDIESVYNENSQHIIEPV